MDSTVEIAEKGIYVYTFFSKEKGRDLTQHCDKNPYTHRKIQKAT